MPFIRQGQECFVGGFDLLDLTGVEDSEDVDAAGNAEKESVDAGTESDAVHYPQQDETAAPIDDKESLVRGTYKCPSCGKDTKRYGQRGMAALRHHIISDHIHESNKLFQMVFNLYSRHNRNFCSPSLICDLCGKTIRGTTVHLWRHQESRNCIPPQANAPGTSALKKRKKN
jgi:hypothetical protein